MTEPTSNSAFGPTIVPDHVKEQICEQYSKTPEGRRILALSMVRPTRSFIEESQQDLDSEKREQLKRSMDFTLRWAEIILGRAVLQRAPITYMRLNALEEDVDFIALMSELRVARDKLERDSSNDAARKVADVGEGG